MFVQLQEFPDYLVNDKGEVVSLKFGRWIELKGGVSGTGYRLVNLCKNGKTYTKNIHKLVIETFFGPCPEGIVVNHKNCSKTDNRLENLEYITQSQNIQHAYNNGLQVALHGQNNPNSKLNNYEVTKLLSLKGTTTQLKAASQFNISQGQVSRIWNNKRRIKG